MNKKLYYITDLFIKLFSLYYSYSVHTFILDMYIEFL